jgi:hypothetical protein
MVAPVIHRASPEARKATTLPMSSGWARRLNACMPKAKSRPTSVFGELRHVSRDDARRHRVDADVAFAEPHPDPRRRRRRARASGMARPKTAPTAASSKAITSVRGPAIRRRACEGIVTSTVFTGQYLPLPGVGFNKVNGLVNEPRAAAKPLLARCDNARVRALTKVCQAFQRLMAGVRRRCSCEGLTKALARGAGASANTSRPCP